MRAAICACLGLLAVGPSALPDEPPPAPPNFLVILLDDVGLDQLAIYHGETAFSAIQPPNDDYPYASTPVIDALAAQGVRFLQARSDPLCSPTRAALHTGFYGPRTGCGAVVQGPTQGADNSSWNFRELGVAPAPPIQTIAHLLKQQSPLPQPYATGIFGKVHLGLEARCPDCGVGNSYPNTVLGFDWFAGQPRNPVAFPRPPFPAICTGDPDSCRVELGVGPTVCGDVPASVIAFNQISYTYYYWFESTAQHTSRTLVHGECTPEGAPPCFGGTGSQAYYFGEHLTIRQRRSAQSWMGQAAKPGSPPFFALLNLTAVHSPWQWPPHADPAGESHGFGPQQPVRCALNTRTRAMLEHADSAIGILLASMAPEVYANTYVILLSDNGTEMDLSTLHPTEVRYPLGHPLHTPGDEATAFTMAPYDQLGMKGLAREAGIRVPLIVCGPGIAAPGSTSDALVDVVDVYETIRDLAWTAAGAAYSPDDSRDSISFADILRGTATAATHRRQCSYSGVFEPNGYTPYQTQGVAPSTPLRSACCDNGRNPSLLRRESLSYVRRDACGRLWKLYREYKADSTGQPTVDLLEFYELGSTPYELGSYELGTSHPAFAAVHDEYRRLLQGETIASIGGHAPLDPCP